MQQHINLQGGGFFMQSLCNKSVSRKDIVKIRYLKEEFDEKSLWKAVICQAIEDATTDSGQIKKLSAKRKAIQWLTEENEDFRIVCHLAGYSHKTVKENLKDLIQTGDTKFKNKQLELFALF